MSAKDPFPKILATVAVGAIVLMGSLSLLAYGSVIPHSEDLAPTTSNRSFLNSLASILEKGRTVDAGRVQVLIPLVDVHRVNATTVGYSIPGIFSGWREEFHFRGDMLFFPYILDIGPDEDPVLKVGFKNIEDSRGDLTGVAFEVGGGRYSFETPSVVGPPRVINGFRQYRSRESSFGLMYGMGITLLPRSVADTDLPVDRLVDFLRAVNSTDAEGEISYELTIRLDSGEDHIVRGSIGTGALTRVRTILDLYDALGGRLD
ncbi:hypothetical protein [Rubrivirga sp. IMCC45206]|uniref:hypothetical protein n=1 Tax=Rubrivirga sp. IMCC45206 TaxID=3391614 RepID=UPI0039903480